MSNEADFTFYRYRAGDPPYRRTPEGPTPREGEAVREALRAEWCPSCKAEVGTNRHGARCGSCGSGLVPISEAPPLRERVATFIDHVLCHDAEAWEEDGNEVAERIEQMFLAAGWCPPQPADEDDLQRRYTKALDLLRAVEAQRNDAQRAGLHFVGKLRDIRAALDDATLTTGPASLSRIRTILDRTPGALSGVEFRDVEERDDASEEQQGCCGACRGAGGDQDGPCTDCLGSGHTHDPDDPCPAPQGQP